MNYYNNNKILKERNIVDDPTEKDIFFFKSYDIGSRIRIKLGFIKVGCEMFKEDNYEYIKRWIIRNSPTDWIIESVNYMGWKCIQPQSGNKIKRMPILHNVNFGQIMIDMKL
jgi:hypothetical protein